MDKLINFHQSIEKVLRKHASLTSDNIKTLTSFVIIDESKEHFLLVDSGWHKHKFIHNLIFHVQIKGEKIWVLENRSDVSIANELKEEGISKEDIVIGFLAPYVREESGFAVV